MPSPHPGQLALAHLMEMDQLQHEEGFRVLFRKSGLNRLAKQLKKMLFTARLFRLRSAVEEILGRFWRRGRNLDSKALPSFQINQTVSSDREKPRFQRATTLVFVQQSRAILARRKAIGPKVGHQIFRLRLGGASRAQDSDQLSVVAPAQLRGRGSVNRQDALDKSEILLVTRNSFDRHKGKRGWGRG